MTKKTYVRTSAGTFLVQLPADNQWGFDLTDGEQSWPGGLGVATNWEAVDAAEVPEEVRAELDWLFD